MRRNISGEGVEAGIQCLGEAILGYLSGCDVNDSHQIQDAESPMICLLHLVRELAVSIHSDLEEE